VAFRIPLRVEAELSEKGAEFRAKLHYQACDDERCLRPADVERQFFVRTAVAGATTAPTAAATYLAPVEDWLANRGLLATLGLVFVMGLGLNLTPCVYPLISVTIAYFGGQGGGRRVVGLSVAYALGIAITFSALGVTAALSGGLFGRALQQPWVLVAIAALMVALAASSFGLYTLQPPPSVMQKIGGSTPGIAGALLMGLTMGIIAAPCVGPIVVGLLVAVGARGDAALGFALFFTLAVGLGAPYVALGVAAGSIARLPRAGEWLLWVERLFGFVLLGLALWFVRPLLSPRAVEIAAAWLVFAAALVLGILDRRGSPVAVVMKRSAGILAIAAAAWIALPHRGPSGGEPIRWTAFSADALAAARHERKPAVVDFRADWCLPCVEMDKTTFVAPEVAERASRFSMLRADVTEMSKESEQTLTQYGVLGVPTTIFFGLDGTERRRMVGYISAEEFVKLLDETGSETKADSKGDRKSVAVGSVID
jgi:thiol:disulfide interchange protein DsbD